MSVPKYVLYLRYHIIVVPWSHSSHKLSSAGGLTVMKSWELTFFFFFFFFSYHSLFIWAYIELNYIGIGYMALL